MRFKFRRSAWFSAGLLTMGIACVVVAGCEQASREARPPDNLRTLVKKPPENATRERNTGGGSQSYAAPSSNSSSQPSGGGGAPNPISELRRAPAAVRPMGNNQPANRGGTKSSKGP